MPELTISSLGEGDDLTDRERLALAMGILREKGWFAPIEWSATLCCTSHGWQQVVEHFGMDRQAWMDTDYDDEPPSIWWHVQNDSLAFYGTMHESPMSQEMEARIDTIFENSGDDEEAVTAWMIEHQDELDADELIERTTKLVNLVDDLSIHWSGGMAHMVEAVAVLRSVGLTVTEPGSPTETMLIHPNHTPMTVRVRADRKLGVWFDPEADGPALAVLSHDDARALITMLQLALARAEQSPAQ